jgi:hypothetical protein
MKKYIFNKINNEDNTNQQLVNKKFERSDIINV